MACDMFTTHTHTHTYDDDDCLSLDIKDFWLPYTIINVNNGQKIIIAIVVCPLTYTITHLQILGQDHCGHCGGPKMFPFQTIEPINSVRIIFNSQHIKSNNSNLY